MARLYIDQAVVELINGLLSNESETIPVYAGIVPNNVKEPYIIYQRVAGFKPARHINGPSIFGQTTFQIDVYSNNYLEVKRIADEIRQILDGYKGTVTINSDSIRIAGCSMVSERDSVEENVEPKIYRASVDYDFMFQEGN